MSCQAFLFENKTELQNYRLSNVFLMMDEKSDRESLYIYETLIEKIQKWSLLIGSQNTKDKLEEIISKIELRQQGIVSSISDVDRHKSMILKFWAWAQSTDFLESKRNEIENIW